jgi:uroporphyrinogen III methyltransferase/synthase
MEEKGLPVEDVQQMTTYAVGPATADALASRGIVVESLPDLFQAEGLASLLDEKEIQGKHFLFPRAKKAREWLLRFLEERGAQVDVAVVYETRSALENRGLLRKILATEALDYLAFTSSSTVRAFVELAGPDAEEAAWYGVPAACIGEITAETARKEGFQHVLAAHPSTIPGLVHAILNHVADNGLLP